MSDIFISYKREERELAKRLASHLQSFGWSVWWDLSLKGGDRFDEVIEHEITKAACVLVLWSPMSVKSTFVRDEAYLALQLGTLLPVMIQPVELPFRFRRLHTINLASWRDQTDSTSIEVLVNDIKSLLSSTKPQRELQQESSASPTVIDKEVEIVRKVSFESKEIEILRLLSNGRTDSEIATMLNSTDQAVGLYLTNIQQKLGASSKHHAVLLGIRAHII